MHRNIKIKDKTNESLKKKNTKDKTNEAALRYSKKKKKAALSISFVNLGKFYSYWNEDL